MTVDGVKYISQSGLRLFSCILTIFLTVSAAPAVADGPHHKIIATKCLANAAQLSMVPLAETRDQVLLDANDTTISRLSAAKHHTMRTLPACGGFHDVTDNLQKSDLSPAVFLSRQHRAPTPFTVAAEYTARYPDEVHRLISLANPQNMWNDLGQLTAFKDRYASSPSGVQAAEWLQSRLNAMGLGHENVSVYTVPTRGYAQPSVIMKVGQSVEPGIVISGHMDTVSGWGIYHMPGADDDGSGSVTVLEAARTLLAARMPLKRPVYFVWYAAEEEGLVGSGSVVAAFKEKNIPVKSVLHFDMTGYEYRNDPTMWLLQDYTNPALTAWLVTLIDTYVGQKVNYTRCGYDCSDHASWTGAGVAAGAATETQFEHMNSSLHTAGDTMDKLSLQHMTDYLKLALAFIVEEAEPISV